MIRQLGLLLVVTYIVSVTARMRPVVCPLYNSPVCASDGETYFNDCFMRMKAAEDVNIVHSGQCSRSKRQIDECFACPAILMPVCGTDGKTYSNDCDLRCNGKGATLAHPGSCTA